MNNVTAKEYLEQYQSADREIDELLERVKRLRSRAEKITPPYGSDGGSNPNVNTDKLPAIVELIIEEEERTNERVEQLMNLQKEIQSNIARVTDETCRTLLIMRYIGGKSFEKIADTMNYSYFHIVRRLHPKALMYIEGILRF